MPWPNVVTTGDAASITMQSDAFQVPGNDLNTNVVLNGTGTILADGTNWGQLTEHFGCPA